MERKLALWIGVPFLGVAWTLIALVALAPGLINSRLLMLLLLALSVAGTLILLVGMAVRDRDNSRLKDTLYPIAGLLIALGVGFHSEIGAFARGIVSYAMPDGSISEGMRFTRADDGWFHVTLTIEGAPVDFTVDPSTPFNVMMPDVPKQIGIDPSSLVYDQQLETASGAEYVADVVLRKAQVGSAVVETLPVKVFATNRLGHNLLGKPFLESFKAWEIEDDTLTIID
jgi:clan AA aspartic protease (TIGR02281 family)